MIKFLAQCAVLAGVFWCGRKSTKWFPVTQVKNGFAALPALTLWSFVRKNWGWIWRLLAVGVVVATGFFLWDFAQDQRESKVRGELEPIIEQKIVLYETMKVADASKSENIKQLEQLRIVTLKVSDEVARGAQEIQDAVDDEAANLAWINAVRRVRGITSESPGDRSADLHLGDLRGTLPAAS